MTKIQSTALLISVTLCWSIEMILMKNIPSTVLPFAVLAMTNGIGFIILSVLCFKQLKKDTKKGDMLSAILLAIMNIFYNALMLHSLRYINSATGSFVISFTIVLIPLMMFLMGRKITLSNGVGVVVIMIGIALASDFKNGSGNMRGILMMLTVCVIRAFYLIKMNDFAKKTNPFVLTVLTEGFVALISFIIWFVNQPMTFFSLEYSKPMLSSIFSDGYFICGYAALLNMIAQREVSPQTCSAIYSFQIIFAVILAAIIPEMLGEAVPLTFTKLIACFIIILGALISEADLLHRLKGRRNAHES